MKFDTQGGGVDCAAVPAYLVGLLLPSGLLGFLFGVDLLGVDVFGVDLLGVDVFGVDLFGVDFKNGATTVVAA